MPFRPGMRSLILIACLCMGSVDSIGLSSKPTSRRAALWSIGIGAVLSGTAPATAATDCMRDCLKNCNLIAPKDPSYCKENCNAYCSQEDRRDGLSGSVSSDRGEVGLLGMQTVVKGDDRPPKVSLPGLDFTSENGRKLIGY